MTVHLRHRGDLAWCGVALKRFTPTQRRHTDDPQLASCESCLEHRRDNAPGRPALPADGCTTCGKPDCSPKEHAGWAP